MQIFPASQLCTNVISFLSWITLCGASLLYHPFHMACNPPRQTHPFSHQARVSRQPRCSRQSLWALEGAEAAVKHCTPSFELGRRCLLRQPATIMSPSREMFGLYKSNAKPTAGLGIQLAPCPGDQICRQVQVAALGEQLPHLL